MLTVLIGFLALTVLSAPIVLCVMLLVWDHDDLIVPWFVTFFLSAWSLWFICRTLGRIVRPWLVWVLS